MEMIKNQRIRSDKTPSHEGSFLNREIRLFPVRFTDKLKESFYLELHTLLTSGVHLKQALELMLQEFAKTKHHSMMVKIYDSLVEGANFWETLEQSGQFTPYEYHAVQIGEETGKLPTVLLQLNRFYTNRLKQRRQLVSSLSYPVIILLTSIGAVSFMLLFIVPMFQEVFKRFGGDLPAITWVIIKISAIIKASFAWVLLASCMLGVFLYKKRKEIWFRKSIIWVIKRIPMVGGIVFNLQLARFCSSMSLLLGAKVPIVRSLELVGKMITFYPIQNILPSIEQSILQGHAIADSFSRHPIFSQRIIALLAVGEEANQLDNFFDKLANQLSSEAEHKTALLNTFLEPLMIIFLGLVVGFILMAMYLPMFQMSTTIGQ